MYALLDFPLEAGGVLVTRPGDPTVCIRLTGRGPDAFERTVELRVHYSAACAISQALEHVIGEHEAGHGAVWGGGLPVEEGGGK